MRYLPDRMSSDLLRAATRRHFFKQSGFGIGAAIDGDALARHEIGHARHLDRYAAKFQRRGSA